MRGGARVYSIQNYHFASCIFLLDGVQSARRSASVRRSSDQRVEKYNAECSGEVL